MALDRQQLRKAGWTVGISAVLIFGVVGVVWLKARIGDMQESIHLENVHNRTRSRLDLENVHNRTRSRLDQIGLALYQYANFHGGAFPADLGGLLSVVRTVSVTPEMFLAGGSATAVPADFAQLDNSKQAQWVNQNTDFIYLGAGRTTGVADDFALVYVKPAASKVIYLVCGNGSVEELSAGSAEKTVAELKAGINPPPSAQDAHRPPTGAAP